VNLSLAVAVADVAVLSPSVLVLNFGLRPNRGQVN